MGGVAIAFLLWGAVPTLAVPGAATPAGSSATEQLLETAETQFQAGQLEAALRLWQQARQQLRQSKNGVGELQVLMKLGSAFVLLDRYQEALPILDTGLALSRHLQNRSAEAQILGNVGIAYQSLGQYSQAIATHRQAGKLLLELGDRQGLGQVLTNLGNTFEAVGDYTNATIAFQQSLKIAQQIGDRTGKIIALGNLGAMAANQGQDQEALKLFQQSLDQAQALNYLPGQASAFLNLGSTHHSLRQLDQAITFYQSSLQLAQKMGDRQREAQALGALGLALADQKNFAAAIQHHEQSLSIGRSLNNPEIQGQALNNLGHALFNAGRLKDAETTLRQAIQLWDALRPELSDRYKVAIFDTQLHTYSLLQQVLVAANKHEAALEAAEWGRARAFAERLARRLRGEGGKGDRSQAAGFDVSAQPNGVRSRDVRSQAPVRPIQMADIRRIAREQKATLVEYAIVTDDDFKFRGKQRGREEILYIWVVQPSGKLHFRRVDLKPLWKQDLHLAKLVEVSRSCLYPPFSCAAVAQPAPRSPFPTLTANTPPQRRVNPALHRLYQLLIQPIADLLPKSPDERIIILPLESLYLVPFPALQRADGQYLIESHTVLTAPAIQVLDLTRQIKAKRQGGKNHLRDRFSPALVVGNPTMPQIGTEPLSPLPASEAEAQQIAELLKTKALIGRTATQTQVARQMANAAVIHLATHGLLEFGQTLEDTGIPGAIALAPDLVPANPNIPNGILTASAILDFRLRANLVVLSACDTGRGRITGDGVQGLSRAFIAAGVPSVIVSLWAVSDASTAHLMVNFYQNLLQQPDKAKALRLAMLETMKKYPRPLDWAAFTLMGEAE
jgi:CHAT domain-containing protein/tetratricopeptide (TPR) repeat protein